MPSPELDAFVRRYNRRRLVARSAVGVVGILITVAWFDAMPLSWQYVLWYVLFPVALVLNWACAKCPECGRFIGMAGYWGGLGRGPRCELELACEDRLEELDGGR